MKGFSLIVPGRTYIGSGSFNRLEEILKGNHTGTALLVSGRSVTETEVWADLMLNLRKAGKIPEHVIVSGEPSPETVDEIAARGKENSVSAIAAVGGGSVLDAGKAAAAMIMENGKTEDYLEGIGTMKPSGNKIPFIAVPTTAGTGSEATKNAVLSRVGSDGFKKSLRHDNYVPDTAIVDPDLTLSCPPLVTAACGMDAFSQLVESYISTISNPYTDALARSGIEKFIGSFLDVCLEEPDNREKRGDLSYASYLSGITLANAGLGTVHGIAGLMGGLFNIPHGIACANLLPCVMTITVRKLLENEPGHPAVGKLAGIGRLVSGVDNQDDDEACDFFLCLLEEWLYALRMPRLGEYGIKHEDLDGIAGAAGNKNNPLPLSKEEIREAVYMRL